MHALVVDDEDGVCSAVATLLPRWFDVRVTTAHSAEEALAAASTDPPDFVITDVVMPGASGISLVSSLRALDPQLPIAVMTSVLGEAREQAFECGAVAFLAKPFRIGDLRATVLALVRAREGR